MSGEALKGKTERLRDEQRPYLRLLAMFPCSGLLATGKTPIFTVVGTDQLQRLCELMAKYREKGTGMAL